MFALYSCIKKSVFLISTLFTCALSAQELVLYNWEEYMDPGILADFEKETGIHVREIYYETDELKNRLLVTTGGEGFDLVVTSGFSLPSYIAAGWVEKLDAPKIPNSGNVDKRWRDLHPSIQSHSVPMLWGTLGIAYRADKVEVPRSWKSLFSPVAELRKRVLMIDDSRDTIGMALKSLGYSANSESEDEIQQAGELLVNQRPYVRGYSYLDLSADSEIVKGDVWMAMAYNGDVLVLQEFNPNVKYVLPEEGGNLWVDYIAVLSRSRQKQAAHRFLDFLLRPEQAARLAEYTQYASTNVEAEKFLSSAHLNNPVIHPGQRELERSEIHKALSPKSLRIRNRVYSEVSK